MPKATVNTTETFREDLKTLPEGFVVLRRMTYGQTVQRRALVKLNMDMGKMGNKNSDVKGELSMGSVEINNFEFKHCIVDHNLEKEDGTKLNLADPVELAMLDPRVGQEIETLISKMNKFEDAEGE